MTGDRLNYLNMALMALSFLLACLCPIELLVISYAVLGPLHYLTEIPWLHKRSYFADAGAGRQSWLLWGLAAASLLSYCFEMRIAACCTFIAIGFAFCLVAVKSARSRVIGLIVLIALSAPIANLKAGHLLFGIFLTTLIHVFFFTWMFILMGCLKEKRTSGYLSLATFTLLAIALLCASSDVHYFNFAAAALWNDNARAAFGSLPKLLSEVLGLGHARDSYLPATRFIAFAYTYHYLNWLSKTKVIKWHHLTPRAQLFIALLYAGSLLTYAIDYRFGLKLLFFLSIGHVYLEFPLNLRTGSAIVKELAVISTNAFMPVTVWRSNSSAIASKG